MAYPHLALRPNRNVLVSHYVVAGSKNPLPLGMGSVKCVVYSMIVALLPIIIKLQLISTSSYLYAMVAIIWLVVIVAFPIAFIIYVTSLIKYVKELNL